mmetsp:Transcript_118717/g.347752  ORF Transcript_118717/g.347752 Transcript_118717/m.347752 type:complete len:300 (-) Transcript_118717:2563-3462(-)
MRTSCSEVHALDLVFTLLVDCPQALQVFLAGVPIAFRVCLKEGGDHVSKRLWILVHHLLPDVLVRDVGLIGILVHKVVHCIRRSAPAKSVAHALRDLADAFVAPLERGLVELRIQQLRPGVQAHLSGQGADLRVGGRGVGDEGLRLLAVRAQALHDLGGVVVEVVRHVRERDLAAVQVLEGGVHLAQRGLEEARGLVQHAGVVGAEGEALAREELLLELGLVHVGAVLHRQAHVRRVGAGGVGEDARCRLSQRDAKLLSLLQRMLPHIVLLRRLVGLGCHLDRSIQEVHLVDEEIAEDP